MKGIESGNGIEVTIRNKGYFSSLLQLKEQVKLPERGDYAIVHCAIFDEDLNVIGFENRQMIYDGLKWIAQC